MTNEDQKLQWTFYHLYDEGKNCYLVGSMLRGDGKRVTPEDHPLNTKETYLEITSEGWSFVAEAIPFVWDDKVKRYITEGVSEVPVEVVKSNLRADIIVRNVLIARKSLDDLFK